MSSNDIDNILEDSGGNVLEAGARLARVLMRSDPAVFKAGYDDEAAAYGAKTAYDLTDAEHAIVLAMLQPKLSNVCSAGHHDPIYIDDTWAECNVCGERYRPPVDGDIDFSTGLYDGTRYEHIEWYIYQWSRKEVPEGSWHPIAGPFPNESAARLHYAERVDAAAWALDTIFGDA